MSAMQPGEDHLYGDLESLIERIRAYTRDGEIEREIAAVTSYIERGIADCEAYLAKYAAFQEFIEGSES